MRLRQIRKNIHFIDNVGRVTITRLGEIQNTEENDVKLYIKQRVFSWRDSYELDITDGINELPCLCVALAVDCAMAVQNSK